MIGKASKLVRVIVLLARLDSGAIAGMILPDAILKLVSEGRSHGCGISSEHVEEHRESLDQVAKTAFRAGK